MRVRRITAAITTVVMVGGAVSIASAPGVVAATYVVDGCQSGSFTLLASDSAVIAFPGYEGPGVGNPTCTPPYEGITSTNTNANSYTQDGYYCFVFSVGDLNNPASFTVSGGGGLQLTYTPRAEGPSSIGIAARVAACGGSNLPSGGSGGSNAGANGPSWFQSYGRADSTDVCQPGWDPSYAAWANQGAGGWVCNRTVYYNPTRQAWQVTFTVTP